MASAAPSAVSDFTILDFDDLIFVILAPVCYNIGLQNLIKITKMWRYNDFQDGDRPPFWIFKVWNL